MTWVLLALFAELAVATVAVWWLWRLLRHPTLNPMEDPCPT